jgi:hypothetical protein
MPPLPLQSLLPTPPLKLNPILFFFFSVILPAFTVFRRFFYFFYFFSLFFSLLLCITTGFSGRTSGASHNIFFGSNFLGRYDTHEE